MVITSSQLLKGPRTLAIQSRQLTAYFHGHLTELILTFSLWRVLLYVGAYLSILVLESNPAFTAPHPLTRFSEFFFATWARWDGDWYLTIIQEGYSYNGPGKASPVAFFPLYPLLVRSVVQLFGRSLTNEHAIIMVGVVLSNLATLGSSLMLYLLAQSEFKRLGIENAEQLALRASRLFLFFPTSIFFASLYPEALFVFLAISCFFCIRKKWFFLAGVLGMVASLTRPHGVLLLLPLAVAYLQYWGVRPRKELFALLLIPLGLGLYMAFLFFRFGDALAFVHVQSAPGWRAAASDIPFGAAVQNIVSYVQHPDNVVGTLEVVYTLCGLFCALLTLRYLPLPYGLFALAVCLLSLASGTMSIQRHVLVAFPIFMTLGLLSRSERLYSLLWPLFIFILGVNTVVWMNGSWTG